nr:TylF/MycF/NovP-related O-methyltransferase [Crocosphaera subtropica]
MRAKKLTYLSEQKLTNISKTCRSIEKEKLPGIFLEAGCALGGSSILIATLKSSKRPMYIYDVFGMIPPPTEKDTEEVHERYKIIVEGKSDGIGGDKYYGYENNLYEIVQSNFQSFGINCKKQSVTMVQGLVQDTLKIEESVAFAHIDVDWYDPVMTCLRRIFPKLVVGGSIILDDYYDWGGCRKATDEYLEKVTGQFVRDNIANAVKITKIT